MTWARLMLAAVVVLAVTPTWADFQAGWDAYDRGDYATALKEWRPLAEQGNALAQYNLGVMYADGQGVPQDFKEAVRWFRRAAKQGDALAQYNLGVMYDKGQGVLKDYIQAARWVRRAAEQGDASAQALLGSMYASGRGVPRDVVRAHLWYNLAAEQGHEGARRDRNEAALSMSPAQIAEAQRLAREWKPSHAGVSERRQP